jgi:hypothetical protein
MMALRFFDHIIRNQSGLSKPVFLYPQRRAAVGRWHDVGGFEERRI